jgi:hypothetical protein
LWFLLEAHQKCVQHKTVHVVESDAPLHPSLWARQAADAAAKHVCPWPTLERELSVPPGLPPGPPPGLTGDTALPPLPPGPPSAPQQPHNQPAAEPLPVRRRGRLRLPPERHDPTAASRAEQCADQESRRASAASANLRHHTCPAWLRQQACMRALHGGRCCCGCALVSRPKEFVDSSSVVR